jgi:hypothetical protein
VAFPQTLDLNLCGLGSLIQSAIQRTGQTPSEFAREAIAKQLGVDVPNCKRGNPKASKETAKKANRARWSTVKYPRKK